MQKNAEQEEQADIDVDIAPLTFGQSRYALMTGSAWHTPSERERVLNRDAQADIVSDISPWHDIKVAAALCHKTQHAMFLRNSGASAVADMVWKTKAFHIRQGQLSAGL